MVYGPGVYPELVRARLARGWPLDRAMAESPLPRARLTIADVRRARAEGQSAEAIAEHLGVTPQHARAIRSGRAWKGV
jgi:hypothetical protein